MSTCSVEKLSRLLGLYEGPVGKTAKTLPASSLVTSNAMFREAIDLDDVSRLTFFSELAAKHLPSLVQATIDSVGGKDQGRCVVLTGWIRTTIRKALPLMTRYLREHPDHGRELFYALCHNVEMFSGLPPQYYDPCIAHQSLDIIPTFLSLLCAAHTTYPAPSLLPISSLIRDILRDAVVKARPHKAVLTPRMQATFETDISIVEYVVAAKSPLDLSEMRRNFASDQWWSYVSCETKIMKTDPGSKCAELDEGQELSVCSRCLSVRYCSPAHQKADWKRHKAECFKPTW